MSTPKLTWRHVARVTIEFTTPFLVGAGEGDFHSDAAFAADANGLPALPGTSLAGVLRHSLQTEDAAAARDLFGFQDGSGGQGSRLSVSWGCLHDSNDRPVEGLLTEERRRDPVLTQARHAVIRDHVRIDHRGVAAEQGKFDERAVAAGHRFTFELMLEGREEEAPQWERLLDLLASGTLRLGGKTRRGFGAFRVVSLREGRFDLSRSEQFEAFLKHPVSLSTPDSLQDRLAFYQRSRALPGVQATLDLYPEDFWMIGGGAGDVADMVPVLERRILWEQGRGRSGPEEVLLPGTAVKGALAHRVAHYANALENRFADQGADPDQCTGAANPAIRALFGFCKDNSDEGRRGRVSIDDQYLPLSTHQQKIFNHVAIDRFTGGSLDGALFNDAPLYGGPGVTLKIVVEEPAAIARECPVAVKALRLALADLVEGRLALGAGGNRGHGYFQGGEVTWSDGGAWIGGVE